MEKKEGSKIAPSPDRAWKKASAISRAISQHYGVRVVGRTNAVTERFYAITVERRIKHPAVVEISRLARERLFAD